MQKLYSTVFATGALSEMSGKDKAFYFFCIFDTYKGQGQGKYDVTVYESK